MKHEDLHAVYERYPASDFVVAVETNINNIADDLASKSVTAWAQGPIAGTNFYKLVECSAQHKGDKRLIIVATLADVDKAKGAHR